MRGHIDVIRELLTAQPQTIFLVNLDGYNILHLCVQYNSLDALKLLVESSTNDDFVNSKDDDGNSILHLATMLGQAKTIKYLLSIPEIKRKANAMNRIGNTALDVSEAACDRDFKCPKIQDILKAAGVKRSKDLNSSPLPTLVLPAETHEPTQSFTGEQSAQSWFRKWWSYFYLCVWAKYLEYQGNWVDETRGTLMLVATVIATMTFQAGINPPGGVWQQDTTNGTFGCNSSMCAAGTAILSYSETYIDFLSFNTTSFVAALTVVLLVTSGFPLRSKGFIWFLTLTMFIAIYSVVVAYIKAVKLVNPTHFQDYSLITTVLPGIWLLLQQVLGAIHVIRFLFWMIRKLFKFLRRCRLTKRPANDAVNV
ncbi:ankyrin repeat-containing protein ITN1-like isoform X2 [Juglans microcarpa x Juglans regia]|nr:ankyrin repeat-containing protein ITN1-like isoform X2 [Juglans microcarpa x Juglans regia]